MNKSVSNIVLGVSMLVPMLAGAATFSLGSFPGGTGFSNADTNSSAQAPFNQLPANGSFSDDWNFTVASNTGGSSNASITGIGLLNLSDFKVVLLGAGGFTGNFNPLFANASNQLLGLTFGKLDTGSYTLRVTGNTFGMTTDSHSYSGNLSIGDDIAAVPLPGAIWLFGSALVGLVSLSKRKKSLNLSQA